MTSTTLKSKSKFTPVLTKTFKQRIANMIAILAVSIFVPVIAIAIIFYNNYTSVSAIPSRQPESVDITVGAVAVTMIMACVSIFFSLSIAPKLFSEIYKKQSCDLYFSLPVKRSDYYISGYIYGALVNIAAIVISNVIYCAVMPILSTKYIHFEIQLGSLLTDIIIPVLLSILATYSAFIMCAVISGRRIQYICLALICLFATSSAINGVLANFSSIWGMSVDGTIPMSIDPTSSILMNLTSEPHWVTYIILLIEAVGMFFAGMLNFNKRKAEVAEVSLSGQIIPFVLLAVLDIAMFMHYSGYGVVISLIAGTIFTVLITMAFTAVFYKKVFTKQTGITAAAVCLVCIIFICSVNIPSFSGYVKKVPAASEVESIEISDASINEIYSSLIINFINDFEAADDSEPFYTFIIKDEKSIADAIAMHNKMVDDKVIKLSQKYTNQNLLTLLVTGGFFDDSYVETYSCKIKYNLKSGKTMSRTYTVNSNLLVSEYVTLMKNDEMLNQLPIFNISEDNVLFSTVDTYNLYPDTMSEDYSDDKMYYDDLVDDEISGEYYDQPLSQDKFDGFKKAYIKNLSEMENNQFSSVFRELNNFEGLYYYSDEAVYYESAAELYIYYMDEDTPEEYKNELKKMTPAEIKRAYENFMFDGRESKYNYLQQYCIYIYANQDNVIKYLKDTGIKFPEE